MRKGKVLYKNYFAGTITETDDGEYVFQYDETYVKEHPGEFITFSMPVRIESYRENRLFAFSKDLYLRGGCWKLLLQIGK